MVKKFLYLNGLAILAVIIFHASGWGFTAMFSWSHQYLPSQTDPYSQMGNISYYSLRMIEQLVVFSIPTFLFVSGFFVAFTTPRNDKTLPWKIVLKRIKFLYIPFFLWTTFVLVTNLVQGKIPGMVDLLKYYLTGSITPAYYFIILLIQYYLLSPVLVPLAKNHWKKLFLGTALLQLFIFSFEYFIVLFPGNMVVSTIVSLFPKWFFPTRLFWFSLGLIIAFHKDFWIKFLEGKAKYWLAITILFYIAGFFEWEFLLRKSGLDWIETRETIIDGIFAFSFLMAFLSTGSKLLLRNQVEKIGSQSLGIYIVHIPVMNFFARAVYHFAPLILGQTILFITLIALIGLFIPLIIMWIFRNTFLRKYYGFIFG